MPDITPQGNRPNTSDPFVNPALQYLKTGLKNICFDKGSKEQQFLLYGTPSFGPGQRYEAAQELLAAVVECFKAQGLNPISHDMPYGDATEFDEEMARSARLKTPRQYSMSVCFALDVPSESIKGVMQRIIDAADRINASSLQRT